MVSKLYPFKVLKPNQEHAISLSITQKQNSSCNFYKYLNRKIRQSRFIAEISTKAVKYALSKKIKSATNTRNTYNK